MPEFSKEQVAALEKILGVKLPEQGFSLEIKPLGAGELTGEQLDEVVGGVNASLPAVQKVAPAASLELPVQRWMVKI